MCHDDHHSDGWPSLSGFGPSSAHTLPRYLGEMTENDTHA